LPLASGITDPPWEARAPRSGDFSVHLATTEEMLPPALDLTFAAGPVERTPTALVVSGPVPEWSPRLVSPELASAVAPSGSTVAPCGSLSAERIASLTALVASLCPFATAVVQPMANHMSVRAADFARDVAGYPANHPSPLWVYPKTYLDEEAAYLETTGMAAFGLPDLAMPIDASRTPAFEDAAYALIRAIVDDPSRGTAFGREGPLPVGARVRLGGVGEIAVEARLPGALWCVPHDASLSPAAVARARRLIGRKRALGALLAAPLDGARLGPVTHDHFPQGGSAAAKEHFVTRTLGFAMTNGASDRLEFVASSPRLGRRIHVWLDWAAGMLRPARDRQPVAAFDRIVLPTPHGPLAGVLVWPFGELLPEAGTPPVELCKLLPLAAEEVDRFRRDGQAQGAWIRERNERRDVHVFEARWDTFVA
jgi:hypothetical protein